MERPAHFDVRVFRAPVLGLLNQNALSKVKNKLKREERSTSPRCVPSAVPPCDCPSTQRLSTRPVMHAAPCRCFHRPGPRHRVL
jgi:hypothetical protein